MVSRLITSRAVRNFVFALSALGSIGFLNPMAQAATSVSQTTTAATGAAAIGNYNLTVEGPLDWAQWGAGGANFYNHKALASPRISDVITLGGATRTAGSATMVYIWNDGVNAPTALPQNFLNNQTATGVIQTAGVTSAANTASALGYQFTVNAPTPGTFQTPRVLKIYGSMVNNGTAPTTAQQVFLNVSFNDQVNAFPTTLVFTTNTTASAVNRSEER